jgi:preprotein translocase subunit SecD
MTTSRFGWLLGVIATVLVALALTVASGAWTPARLAADQAGYVMVLTGSPAAVGPTVQILRDRLTAAGYRAIRVSVPDPGRIVIVAAGPGTEGLRLLATPGRLSFRAVLAGPDLPWPAGPAAEPDQDTVTCTELDAEAPQATGGPLAACGPAGRYLLDGPTVSVADVASVNAELNPAGWSVRIGFTARGRARWHALTESARHSPVSRQIAIVVDQRILTAPRIDEPAPDTALVTRPTDNQRQAVELAALLRFGPLPATFTVERISAQ